jgi:DNA mismatch repair protein MutS
MELKNKEHQQASPTVQATTEKFQLSIFDAHTETFENIRSILDAIDINNLTPLDALQKLQEIKNKIK